MSEVDVGVGDWGWNMECEMSGNGVDRGCRGGNGGCDLKLECPDVIAEKGLDPAAGNEDKGGTVVVGRRADCNSKFTRSRIFPVTWRLRFGCDWAPQGQKKLG